MPEYPLTFDTGVMVFEVTISGHSRQIPLKMVCDTGATMTTIPKEAAIAVGCDPIKSKRRIEMITASGTEYVPIVTIPKIKWLDFELEKVEAICHSLPPQTTISGLLGLNVLRGFNIGFNFPQNTLSIIKAPQ